MNASSVFRSHPLSLALILLALTLLLAGCDVVPRPVPTAIPVVQPTAQPGLPNPASVYCQEQGGRLEIRTAADGGQVGYCVFTDGSECEEWAFFRGECSHSVVPTTVPPNPDTSTEALLATVQSTLPPDAFEGFAVMPLSVPEGSQPLWAVSSYGMRNFDLDPPPGHFVAIFAQDPAGWQELSRFDLDMAPIGGDPLVGAGPDYVAQDGVKQASIDPSRVWLQVDGGVGAHSGTFQVLSFDGQSLRQEVGGASSSPGAGYLADLNSDGQQDVVLNATERYIFCYACGVSAPYFQVYTWDGRQMRQVAIAPMGVAEQSQSYWLPNNEAVRLAEAGLWAEALAKISEATELAGDVDPPTAAGSLRWNEALIRLDHDAYLEALRSSPYPLLSSVFYGDYAGAVDVMRPFSLSEIFSQDTPLIKGTVAEGWEESLANYLIQSATDALARQPDLAPAYFVRAWGGYLADPGDPKVRQDLARAAALAPGDPLFAAAAAPGAIPAPPLSSSGPKRIQFARGATSATVNGELARRGIDRYVLTAMAGQSMQVAVNSAGEAVVLAVQGEDGMILLNRGNGQAEWSGVLPKSQDYIVSVISTGAAAGYALTVTIPPLEQ
jgi:putative hemolysin